MRVHRAHLGDALTISTVAKPPNLYPGVPAGYAGTLPTGVIPGNISGETQPTGAGGQQCDPVTDPNCYTALQIQQVCESGGGTWDYGNQACVPPKPAATNYTPILIAGVIAIFALLMVVMGGRR